MNVNKLLISRVLIVIGLLIGWESLYQTFSHIGDPLFMISPDHPGGADHSWYHVLREAMGSLATICLTLVVFFGKDWFRNPGTWYITLIALIGYYSPFWVGAPFNPALAAPTWDAELRHILQAAIPLTGMFLARKDFFAKAAISSDQL